MGLFSKSSSKNRAGPSQSSPNPHISQYNHLHHLERADEALKLLHQLASTARPIMRKRNWVVGTLAEFLPDNPRLQGLNTNSGEIIHVRLRPSHSPGSFHDFETCMDTMLHELVHNVHGEHDKSFYALLEEITAEWRLLSSKGYRGEGFFSQGQRLGNGHVFYKPKTALSPADLRRIRDRAENDRKGIRVSPVGQRLGGPTLGPQMDGDTALGGVGGVRLGGVGIGGVMTEMDPRRLAAMAAERRAMDQKRCGAKQAVGDMRRETEKAQREGTMTQSRDMPNIIDLDDLDDYDLEDFVMDLDVPSKSSTSLAANSSSASTTASTWTGPDSGWVCSECTLQNPAMYLVCSVCQNARSMQLDEGNIIDLTGDIGSSWDCGLCTFRNENVTDGKCGVCGTEMP